MCVCVCLGLFDILVISLYRIFNEIMCRAHRQYPHRQQLQIQSKSKSVHVTSTNRLFGAF